MWSGEWKLDSSLQALMVITNLARNTIDSPELDTDNDQVHTQQCWIAMDFVGILVPFHDSHKIAQADAPQWSRLTGGVGSPKKKQPNPNSLQHRLNHFKATYNALLVYMVQTIYKLY